MMITKESLSRLLTLCALCTACPPCSTLKPCIDVLTIIIISTRVSICFKLAHMYVLSSYAPRNGIAASYVSEETVAKSKLSIVYPEE